MKFKFLLTLLVAGTMVATAQNQGFKDGIEYYKAGFDKEAKIILDKTIDNADTDKALANYYLGQVALNQGDKAAAKAYFEAGLAANVSSPYNYVGLGALELLNGNAQAANDFFKKAQSYGKKNHEVTIAIARAYYNADPVAYAKEIQKFIDKARKDSKNQDPNIYVLEGDMLSAKEDYGQAAASYEQAITFDANNPEGYVKYANAYFFVNPAFAIQKLEEYYNSHPNSALAQRELAEKYYSAHRWRAASDLYGKYIQNPNHFPEDKARYAVLLYWGEDYPASLSIAQDLLKEQPENFLGQRLQFLNQEKMGNHEAAVANAQVFFAIPNARFTQNDYETYAEALAATGQDSLAVVQYELAIAEYPEDGDLLKNASSFYSQLNYFAKSADAYAAYLALQENPTVNDLFGASGRYLNASLKTDDEAEAVAQADKGIALMTQVLERAEPNVALYQRLGRLYVARNGKKPDANAIEAYDKVLEMLDADPSKKDLSNPSNGLDIYTEAYSFEVFYYGPSITNDKDKYVEFTEKYNEIKAIKEGNAPAGE